PIANPAGCVMKSKPLLMPRRRMFSSVLENRYAPAATISASTTTWYSTPRKALLRQDQLRDLGGALTRDQPDRVRPLLDPSFRRPSPHGRRVHEAALAPQVVGTARQLQRRLRAHVALEDLAIVAHRL